MTIRSGGYVDYFSPVLERHEVIYAECIPVESLEVSRVTLEALPEDVARDLGETAAGIEHEPHFAPEIDRTAAPRARDRLLDRGKR